MAGIATYVKSDVTRHIERNRPLADLTTFRVGGPADFFLRCETRNHLQQVADMCRQEGMPLRVIGGGSNLLIADQGVRGMVVDISKLKRVRVCGTRVAVEAGMKLTSLIASTARAGLQGLEGLAAIPGTLGGAIAMNAGGRYGEIGDVLERVVVITQQGELVQLEKSDLKLGYRSSQLKGSIVVEAYIKLQHGNAEQLVGTVRELSAKKLASQPYDQYSAGCTFRNPDGYRSSAGKLIDMTGLKGERIGDAQISERHGNFIINLGSAKARDVDRLTELAQQRVFEAHGIRLKREVKFWAA